MATQQQNTDSTTTVNIQTQSSTPTTMAITTVKTEPVPHVQQEVEEYSAPFGDFLRSVDEFQPVIPNQVGIFLFVMLKITAPCDPYFGELHTQKNANNVSFSQVTLHYMQRAGLQCSDPRMVAMISMAAQKFTTDIVNDSVQYAKLRAANEKSSSSSGKNKNSNNLALTMDDLTSALSEQGIRVRKPPYFQWWMINMR